MPIKAPETPPSAPPTPSPASPAMIGPAAMNGPRPGIANRPAPASRPTVPPITPPAVTPAAAPSDAFVDFSVPSAFSVLMSLGPPRVSGSSTEISETAKPALTSECAAFSIAIRVEWIPNTPTLRLISFDQAAPALVAGGAKGSVDVLVLHRSSEQPRPYICLRFRTPCIAPQRCGVHLLSLRPL